MNRLLICLTRGAAALALFLFNPLAHASTVYGELSNFDAVNDTGQDCHGFEIELEDVRSTDVTYTYDYNHYGPPVVRQDDSDPAHPKTIIRYASSKDSAGNYSSYTAVPSAPIQATQGHQCTDPSVNFGCEHFGVGLYSNPSVSRYNWLIDDGAGNLVKGPAVDVVTPTLNYVPAAGNVGAQLIPVVPAPREQVQAKEFGNAVWLKSIVTTSHNNNKIELRDLVSDDPGAANEKNWRNGEPAEVEIEWQILQTEFADENGGNGEIEGNAEDFPNGDEVITRRFETYKYAGPYDPETNEALCDEYPVPANNVQCANSVGDYIGAQMVGFDAVAALGLIDNVQDGTVGEQYPSRTVVVGGNSPYQTVISRGALPAGLSVDSETGVLSGTPNARGLFSFTVDAVDADDTQVSHDYTLTVTVIARDGDVDGDGDIDVNDLNAMKTRFGRAANGPADLADVNHDGVINVLDFRKTITMCTRAKCAA